MISASPLNAASLTPPTGPWPGAGADPAANADPGSTAASAFGRDLQAALSQQDAPEPPRSAKANGAPPSSDAAQAAAEGGEPTATGSPNRKAASEVPKTPLTPSQVAGSPSNGRQVSAGSAHATTKRTADPSAEVRLEDPARASTALDDTLGAGSGTPGTATDISAKPPEDTLAATHEGKSTDLPVPTATTRPTHGTGTAVSAAIAKAVGESPDTDALRPMSVADTLSRGSVPSTVRAAKDAESGSRRANATVGDPGAAEQAASVQARGADSGDILATSAGTGAIAALFTGRPTEPGSASPGTSGASLGTGVGGAMGLVGPGGGGIPHSSPLEARLVAEAHVATPMDQPGFVPAFSARIATLVRDGIEQARIRLNPLDMGPVAVQLALDGTQVRVDLAAEVAATRQLLEQSLPSLAGALREAGFTLSGGGVFQQSRQGLGGEPQASSSSARAVSATDDHADAATDSAAARGGSWGRAGRGLIDVFA